MRLGFDDVLRPVQKVEYRQRKEERRRDDRNVNRRQQGDPVRVHRGHLIPLAHHEPLALLLVQAIRLAGPCRPE